MDLNETGRYYALRKSFKNSIKCILTCCSREVVKDAFPSFTDEERERLHRMLTDVMRCMHTNIEEAFDELCQEQQVAAALHKIDGFVEEYNLDQLSSDKTSIDAIEEEVSRMKKNEMEYLADALKKVEESNNAMKARIELLKKDEDLTAARDLVHKMTQWNSACLNNSDM